MFEHMFYILWAGDMMGTPILAPIGPLRARNGGSALLAYREGLRRQITGHTPAEHVARLYAGRLVEVDDAYCRTELGLVVAGDEIRRDDLDAVVRHGRSTLTCLHAAPHTGCEACAVLLGWGRLARRLGHR